MNHPQSLAEKLYQQFPCTKLKSIKENACCILTLMWCLGIEPDDCEAIMTVGRMLDKKVLDSDCTVYWNKCSLYLTGKPLNVQFAEITDKKQLKKIKERTPVYFEYNGKGHWVGVEQGKIGFSSLDHSVCVEKGKPTKARILLF